MKRKKRDLSAREQKLIDGFIEEICEAIHLPSRSKELRQCAWEAFLSVYRDAPASFSSSSFRGWERAYSIIWDALRREKQAMDFFYYGRVSLNQPAQAESPVPRVELLQASHGDFQDNVCFFDYIQHIERDARLMANGLLRGSTIDEIQAYYQWSHDRTSRTYDSLRQEMARYLSI